MTANATSQQDQATEVQPAASGRSWNIQHAQDTLDDLGKRFEDMENDADDVLDSVIAKAGGVATLALSAAFNDMALPPGFAEKFAQLITMLSRVAGDLSIGNGAGSVDEKTKEERQQEAEEEAQQAFRDQMESIERQQEQEREAAWDSQKHDFAGMSLTGEEIDEVVEVLSDPVKRQKLIERRAKEKGIPIEQAERDVDNARRLAELYKMRETGKPMTPEQKEQLRVLEADQGAREASQMANDERLEAKYGKPSNSTVARAQITTSTSESALLGADVLDRPFPNAPALQEQFAEAKTAIEPLDAQKPPKAPTVVASAERAAPSPQVAASGFDV